MGLLGGSRIDGMTVFLVVTLIMYSLLVSGVYATFAGGEFENPYSNLDSDFKLGSNVDFKYNDYENVTPSFFAGVGSTFDDLSPVRYGIWWDKFLGEPEFYVKVSSINWWQSGSIVCEPRHTVSWVLENYDYDLNQTFWVVDSLTDWATWVYIKPQLYYNNATGEVTYLYDSLEESIENDVVTMVLSTNATLENQFSIDRVLGLLTGFDYYDIPVEIGVIVSAVFYAMLVLVSVKLVVG